MDIEVCCPWCGNTEDVPVVIEYDCRMTWQKFCNSSWAHDMNDFHDGMVAYGMIEIVTKTILEMGPNMWLKVSIVD